MAQTQINLTKGGVPRQLVRYAMPVVATSLLQAVYSIIDMIVVENMIGPSGASAVNNASQFMLVLTQISIGLSNGGNVLVGQYFGSGDEKNRRQTIGTFLSLFGLLGVLCAVTAGIAARPFLTFMGAPALEEAVSYLSISTVGLFFTYGYNALASVLRAVGNSKKPLHFILVATALNIILDIIFVGPLQLGTAGAALATVIAQGIAFIMALFFLIRHQEIFSFQFHALRIQSEKIKMILKVGVPCAIQMTVAGISWLTITFLINRYGTEVSAANGFSVKIKDFSMMFITAMSTAASSMVAQNLGAECYDRARAVIHTAMKLAVGMSLILIMIVELTAPWLMGLLAPGEAEVIRYGALNLRIEILGQVFYAIFLTYHALMIGAGHTWWVFASSFANCIVFRVILAIAFEHCFGIVGVFAACAIAPSISVPIGILYMRSGRWRRSLAK